MIGYSHDPASISAAKLMCYELQMLSSLGYGGGDYPEIVDLVRQGKLRLDPIVSGTVPLEEVNEGFDWLHQGEGVGWVVTP